VFAADDVVHGNDLWTSNGTTAGTMLLADVAPDLISSSPTGFQRAGLDLYFVADDYAHGQELWRVPLAQLEVPLVDSIAPGCAPIGGPTPRLSALGLPVLGNPAFGLRLEDAAPIAFVLTAFQFTPVPAVPLLGCTIATSTPAVLLADVTDNTGTQTTTFAIPPSAGLLGLVLIEQDVVFDANGPQGVITASNALRTMIGQ
jgi:ELWxxDGT repeat protein